MSVWDLAEILAAKRGAPELDVLAFRTPARPPGPSRRRLPRPEQIAGNVSESTSTASRFASNGRFTNRRSPQSCPEP
jgi:hypothetical protein